MHSIVLANASKVNYSGLRTVRSSDLKQSTATSDTDMDGACFKQMISAPKHVLMCSVHHAHTG